MKSIVCFLVLAFAAFFSAEIQRVAADEYFVGEVSSPPTQSADSFLGAREEFRVLLPNGEQVTVEAGDIVSPSASRNFSPGDTVVLRKDETGTYTFLERFRLSGLLFLALLFLGIVFFIAQKRGFFALLGLLMSGGVIFFFFLPMISAGGNVLSWGLATLFFLAALLPIFAHGLRKETTLVILSISLTLLFALGCSLVAIHLSFLFGLGGEMVSQLVLSGNESIDFRGLLVLGFLLGTLGVLDDVASGQVATVRELADANPTLSVKELFFRASRVGSSHLISLINTLFLAYAGVSLPLLLVFFGDEVPVWVLLNSEMIAEEIIRTLIGSLSLFVAVPLSTILAAFTFGIRGPDLSSPQ